MANLTPPPTTASKLRTLLAQQNEIVVCPGVYDGFTARLALNAGFQILYMVNHSISVNEILR
jgi:2-methylisocitrate lyase-like PEP mutase family enzyme